MASWDAILVDFSGTEHDTWSIDGLTFDEGRPTSPDATSYAPDTDVFLVRLDDWARVNVTVERLGRMSDVVLDMRRVGGVSVGATEHIRRVDQEAVPRRLDPGLPLAIEATADGLHQLFVRGEDVDDLVGTAILLRWHHAIEIWLLDILPYWLQDLSVAL